MSLVSLIKGRGGASGFGYASTAEEVTADMRRKSKAINFGVIYGISGFGLARNLRIPRAEAQGFIDRYFERFPGIQRYIHETLSSVREKGYSETLFGRKCWFPRINAPNQMERQGSERAAINAPVQGTCADIIKRAMIDIDRWIAGHADKAKMLLQVHDELVFECPEKQAKKLAEVAAKTMAAAPSPVVQLNVPLVVEANFAKSWAEAH